MDDCIFCKIINGEIPSCKVFEDESFLAFLDINPVSKGHTLVIPKRHYEQFHDIPLVKIGDYFKIVQKVALGIKKGTGCDGYNIIANNHAAAGQEVPHVHFHIIPRKDGDGVDMKWPKISYEEGEIDVFVEKIKNKI